MVDYHARSRKKRSRSRSRETMGRRRKEHNYSQSSKTSHRPVNQLVQLRVVCLAADSALSARTSSWPGCCWEALASSAAFALSASITPGLFCSLLLPAADSEVDDASVFNPPNKYRFTWPKGRCCFSSSFFCFMISPMASFFTISDCSGVAVPAACARFASSSLLSSLSTHRAR